MTLTTTLLHFLQLPVKATVLQTVHARMDDKLAGFLHPPVTPAAVVFPQLACQASNMSDETLFEDDEQ